MIMHDSVNYFFTWMKIIFNENRSLNGESRINISSRSDQLIAIKKSKKWNHHGGRIITMAKESNNVMMDARRENNFVRTR